MSLIISPERFQPPYEAEVLGGGCLCLNIVPIAAQWLNLDTCASRDNLGFPPTALKQCRDTGPDQTDLRGMMQVSHPCFYALALVECNRRYACLLLDNRDALVEDPQRNLETWKPPPA